MRVILLDKIYRLGNIGDEVKVRAGYARNYLLPQKRAVLATEENRSHFEQRRQELQVRAQHRLEQAQARAEKIAALDVLTVEANVGENGELYGSVGARELMAAFSDVDIAVERGEIVMAQALQTAGEHTIEVRLHSEVAVSVRISIIPAQVQ